ncbi:ABC transporter permease [Phytoactinopolyspora limicola]|uniref:ABC transporter permease n=1 Tax=Phytoactinopolyspora limicola TaxID=2715536 RepID=UPI001408B019|nr:ABC transporter permease [Phytoactinopolyspora limicola]
MGHLANVLIRLVLPAALIGLWQVASTSGWVNPVFVPPPDRVARTGYEMLTGGDLIPAAAATTGRALLGLAIAIVIAVPAGLVFASSRLADGLTYPAREFFRALPTVTIVPALMVIVGPGESLSVLAVVFGAVWPILLGTILGVRETDRVLLDVARVHRLSARRAVVKIRLPAALPQIMTGIRISLAIALVIALVVEMMSGHGGLGSMVVEARSRFRNTEVFAIVAVIGVVGLVLNALMVRIERRTRHDVPA